MSCYSQKLWWVNVTVKRRDLDHVMCELERRAQANLRIKQFGLLYGT